jgi:hypothetical protein
MESEGKTRPPPPPRRSSTVTTAATVHEPPPPPPPPPASGVRRPSPQPLVTAPGRAEGAGAGAVRQLARALEVQMSQGLSTTARDKDFPAGADSPSLPLPTLPGPGFQRLQLPPPPPPPLLPLLPAPFLRRTSLPLPGQLRGFPPLPDVIMGPPPGWQDNGASDTRHLSSAAMSRPPLPPQTASPAGSRFSPAFRPDGRTTVQSRHTATALMNPDQREQLLRDAVDWHIRQEQLRLALHRELLQRQQRHRSKSASSSSATGGPHGGGGAGGSGGGGRGRRRKSPSPEKNVSRGPRHISPPYYLPSQGPPPPAASRRIAQQQLEALIAGRAVGEAGGDPSLPREGYPRPEAAVTASAKPPSPIPFVEMAVAKLKEKPVRLPPFEKAKKGGEHVLPADQSGHRHPRRYTTTAEQHGGARPKTAHPAVPTDLQREVGGAHTHPRSRRRSGQDTSSPPEVSHRERQRQLEQEREELMRRITASSTRPTEPGGGRRRSRRDLAEVAEPKVPKLSPSRVMDDAPQTTRGRRREDAERPRHRREKGRSREESGGDGERHSGGGGRSRAVSSDAAASEEAADRAKAEKPTRTKGRESGSGSRSGERRKGQPEGRFSREAAGQTGANSSVPGPFVAPTATEKKSESSRERKLREEREEREVSEERRKRDHHRIRQHHHRIRASGGGGPAEAEGPSSYGVAEKADITAVAVGGPPSTTFVSREREEREIREFEEQLLGVKRSDRQVGTDRTVDATTTSAAAVASKRKKRDRMRKPAAFPDGGDSTVHAGTAAAFSHSAMAALPSSGLPGQTAGRRRSRDKSAEKEAANLVRKQKEAAAAAAAAATAAAEEADREKERQMLERDEIREKEKLARKMAERERQILAESERHERLKKELERRLEEEIAALRAQKLRLEREEVEEAQRRRWKQEEGEQRKRESAAIHHRRREASTDRGRGRGRGGSLTAATGAPREHSRARSEAAAIGGGGGPVTRDLDMVEAVEKILLWSTADLTGLPPQGTPKVPETAATAGDVGSRAAPATARSKRASADTAELASTLLSAAAAAARRSAIEAAVTAKGSLREPTSRPLSSPPCTCRSPSPNLSVNQGTVKEMRGVSATPPSPDKSGGEGASWGSKRQRDRRKTAATATSDAASAAAILPHVVAHGRAPRRHHHRSRRRRREDRATADGAGDYSSLPSGAASYLVESERPRRRSSGRRAEGRSDRSRSDSRRRRPRSLSYGSEASADGGRHHLWPGGTERLSDDAYGGYAAFKVKSIVLYSILLETAKDGGKVCLPPPPRTPHISVTSCRHRFSGVGSPRGL